jgi:CubicO group peptidase (beta-lactamase class C family)
MNIDPRLQAGALAIMSAILGAPAIAAAAPVEVQWGRSGDIPVPKDFDNDGYADYVVFRPADGIWYIKSSATGSIRTVRWGQLGDVPLPGDYDGDGRQDFAVWRPSTGGWWVMNHDGLAIRYEQWGQAGDVPVPGDYDGDGRLDLAVWRPGNGVWYVRSFVTGVIRTQQWGQAGDVLVPGDYDAVAGDDFAFWRPSTGQWSVLGARTGLIDSSYNWGLAGDVPSTARFDCTGKAGHTIWRGWDNGGWWIQGQPVVSLGAHGDVAVPANFSGDATPDYATWRPSNGKWLVRNHSSVCDTTWNAATALVDAAATSDVEGVTVAAVKNGAIVWSYGAGMANAWQAATPQVPWQVASISKLFVATAALQMINRGRLAFDSPSGLTNPLNSSQPTLRHHATHTSGIQGGVCTISSFNGAEPSANLTAVLDQCFSGDPEATWLRAGAGEVTQYSNLGAAWPARMVELASRRDFAGYTRDAIFAPLGMSSTAWFASELAGRELAVGYWGHDAPTYETGVSPYPMGNLRASALDLARFMIMYTSDGMAFGNQVLTPGTVALALTALSPNGVGFFWWPRQIASGRRVWSHGGALAGICTRILVDPTRREGVVILTNGNCDVAAAHIDKIEDRVFQTLGAL